MALTPEEQAELAALEAQERKDQTAEYGAAAVKAVAPSGGKQPRPFSIWRATVGGLRDAAQGLADLSDEYASKWQGAYERMGVSKKVARVISGRALLPGAVDAISDQVEDGKVKLDNPEGSEDAGTPEKVVRGLVEFTADFGGAMKALKGIKAATKFGKFAKATVAGAAADFSQFDPVGGNIANVLRDGLGLDSKVLDALASEEDDDRLWQRTKAAIGGTIIGVAADATVEAAVRGVRAYRATRVISEEKQAAIDAVKADLKVSKVKPVENLPVKFEPRAANDNADAAAGAKATREGDRVSTEPRTETPVGAEDILSYLHRAADEPVTDLNTFTQFADNLMFGDPENALAKIGIDPVKLDFEKFDEPAMLGRFQIGLAEVYEKIAAKLGRTGVRVTEAATMRAARAFGSTPEILKETHEATADLASKLTGARLFVGAHAHKLMDTAKRARAEIVAGGRGDAWVEFIEAMHRHAYYLGALRGAGSETGRALQSLQFTAKVRKSRPKPDGTAGGPVDADAAQGFDAINRRYRDDYDAMEVIDRLIGTGGDLGQMAQLTRREALGPIGRVDAALSDTRGSLWSLATLANNVVGGTVFMGLRNLSTALAGVGRMAMTPFGRANADIARRHFAEAHAYVYGSLTGVREGISQAWQVLKRDFSDEAALNVDNLGFRGLAADMRAMAGQARGVLANDVHARAEFIPTRAFALNQQDRYAFADMVEKTGWPQFMQDGLGGLLRVLGVPVNLAGSAFRLSTSTFISAPDQFLGAIVARAGAAQEAVRIASREAVEAELEGKALADYMKYRAIELADIKPGFADDPWEAGKQEVMSIAGEREVDHILFQDELALTANRKIANFFTTTPFMHIFMPIVRTPLRILEVSALEYTPLGLLSKRYREAILKGGVEADEAKARLFLGTSAMMMAAALADELDIVGHDGGYQSSARLSRPSYSLKIGDDVVEFSRLDPVGTLLGMGADLRAMIDQEPADPEEDDEFSEKVGDVLGAFALAVSMNILSKSYMESLEQLAGLVGMNSEDDADVRIQRYLNSLANRTIPASGIQRQLIKTDDEPVREAFTFYEAQMRASVGADTLPVKRDQLLGRPLKGAIGDAVGLNAGPRVRESHVDELERLSFRVTPMPRKLKGVKLTSSQYSRLLELRGQVVQNPDTGLTLEDTMKVLVDLPEYKAMPDEAKVDAIKAEIKPFTRLAKEELIREDRGLAYKVLRRETIDALHTQGATATEKNSEVQRLAKELGLEPVD